MNAENVPNHKEAAVSFLKTVGAGQIREAYNRFVSPNFRHHNAYFRGDRESLMLGMEANASQFPGKTLDVKRVLEDRDFVAVHSHVRLKPGDLGVALVHIFRFENDKIVEAWDVGQPIPSESSNQYGVF